MQCFQRAMVQYDVFSNNLVFFITFILWIGLFHKIPFQRSTCKIILNHLWVWTFSNTMQMVSYHAIKVETNMLYDLWTFPIWGINYSALESESWLWQDRECRMLLSSCTEAHEHAFQGVACIRKDQWLDPNLTFSLYSHQVASGMTILHIDWRHAFGSLLFNEWWSVARQKGLEMLPCCKFSHRCTPVNNPTWT